jgi:hypothetical protein
MLGHKMVEVVDAELLKELCLKHGVPFALAQKIISEFSTIDASKKRYVQQVIEEEWGNYVDKKTGS